MAEEIINKVAQSALVQIDLEDYYQEGARKSIDLKDWLYEGLILREKDFRESVKSHDWEQYENAFVSIHCSTDAIIPLWASMVLTAALQPFAKRVVFGTQEELEALLYEDAFAKVMQRVNVSDLIAPEHYKEEELENSDIQNQFGVSPDMAKAIGDNLKLSNENNDFSQQK